MCCDHIACLSLDVTATPMSQNSQNRASAGSYSGLNEPDLKRRQYSHARMHGWMHEWRVEWMDE